MESGSGFQEVVCRAKEVGGSDTVTSWSLLVTSWSLLVTSWSLQVTLRVGPGDIQKKKKKNKELGTKRGVNQPALAAINQPFVPSPSTSPPERLHGLVVTGRLHGLVVTGRLHGLVVTGRLHGLVVTGRLHGLVVTGRLHGLVVTGRLHGLVVTGRLPVQRS
ncbi:hypothetical protein EYF80_066519 [Liparis tanakae]|uniref:Uncharacterized protein n=1 Tax=Liparis tanakae TaxID=230148 RepID=A0A4Z2E3U1_9TELE|nr:hypothetical protein EYF80_066519 [Liparis tanakae]